MAQRFTSALVLMNADTQHGASAEHSIASLHDHLEHVGIAADIRLITDSHPVHELADCAIVARYDLVIAAGGDGTVQQVAACLLDAAVPLGILPLGTMNTIAFNLGIPTDLAAACPVLTAGTPRHIDMGLVTGQPFVEVVTIGTATEIAGIGEDSRHHGMRGVWQGVVRAIRQLSRFRRHAVTLTYDGHRTYKQVWEVTIANMPIYGLRFAPATSARLDDGLLDVILTRQRALWRYAW